MPRFAIGVSLGILLLLGADNPLEGDKFLQKADEKFEQTMTRAQDAYAKTAGEAFETRLKTYRGILAAATKSGDFDRATAVKVRIEEIEAEREGVGASAPGKKKAKARPKNTLKLGGHEYAVIEEHATWHLAEKHCEEMGGHLITLESQPEVDLAVRTAATLNQQLWLGASDEAQEGKWMWVTGQPVEPVQRQSWTIKNDHGGQHHLYMLINGEIYDWFAGARQAYICEWDN